MADTRLHGRNSCLDKVAALETEIEKLKHNKWVASLIRRVSNSPVAYGDTPVETFRCPECGNTDELSFDVCATVYVDDYPRPTNAWTMRGDYDARCASCDYEGICSDFIWLAGHTHQKKD